MNWLFWSSLAGLGGVYLGYPLVVWCMARLRPRPVEPSHDPGGSLSVVIAAHNEAAVLPDKIQSLLSSTFADRIVEILVADDGSTDGTAQSLEAVADNRIRCLTFRERRGKAACLNDAVAVACGEFLVLTDARQAVAPDALERLVCSLGDPSVGVASGELVFRPASDRRGIAAYWDYERFVRRQESLAGSVPGATGALYALRRGQFPPLPAGTVLDDVYVPMTVMESGLRCVLVSGAYVYDEPSSSARAEFARKRRTLAGCLQLIGWRPRWLLSGAFLVHKAARLATPILLACLFIGSWAVWPPLFWAQLAAGAATLLGWMGAVRGSPIPGLRGIAWFAVLNVAALAALADGVRGRYPAAWDNQRDRP